MTQTLLTGGHVLTMDRSLGDLPRGDVLVEDGKIVAVGTELDAPGATVVDASGMIVMPGLIDTHNHLWQTPVRGLASDCWGGDYFPTIHPLSQNVTPADLATGTLSGIVELLAQGVTTVYDFCHTIHSPEHAETALEVFERSGIRAIFGYSMRDRPELESRTLRSTEARMADLRRLAGTHRSDRVQLAVAMNNIEHVSDEQNAAEATLGRELGIPITVHSIVPDGIATMHRVGMLGADLQWVHATASSQSEFELLAEHGGSVSSTPESEAMVLGQWPVAGRTTSLGIPTGLGIDVPSALPSSILNQVRSILTLDRLQRSTERRFLNYPSAKDGHEQPLDARRALELATIEAAVSIGLGDVTGSLTPGKAADILVLRVPQHLTFAGDAAAHVAVYAERGDVHSVYVDGVARVVDGEVQDVDLPKLEADLASARDAMMRGRHDHD